ncbi:MAG: alpha-2-macroglobulin family protein [Candidatus Pseudobacter hemicellulosilyticus]|uniref:Alpha-2-macroglobulin family protein n=1 Tax=Candidatus Pseudobacter hemicellulosilyticus TaxID=3121375 RepID=A0AAJ5WU83_9BACT|nr:MAG: alpha-2-macroglobulin family protein [Pseudobacter sp.]
MWCKKSGLLVLITLLLTAVNAQQKMNTYDRNWKKIDSLIEQAGLPQSALKELDKLTTLARQEKNEPQLIRTLIYRLNFQDAREENAAQKNITLLQKEISTSSGPARAILQSMTAEAYKRYFEQNRWRIYDRSETSVTFNKDNIATWSADELHREIGAHYLASLSNEKQLQQTRLEPFDPILIKGNTRKLRPTLFDLLAFRALDYFQSKERTLTQPAYAFELNEAAAFADAPAFAAHTFSTRDSSSLSFKALQLYQRILRFHLADTQPYARIDADINRIAFVYNNSTHPDKETLYTQALKNLASQYGQQPAAAQASYLLAAWYAQQARSYEPGKDSTHRYAYLEAAKICQQILLQKDSSEGKTNCQQLLAEIQRPYLSLSTEMVNLPAQPFRSLVQYRNISRIYGRLIRMDLKSREALGSSWEDAYWNKLLKLPSHKTFTQSLPDTRDHQEHGVEIPMEGLPVGMYALVSSTGNDFQMSKDAMALQFFYVSGISYINRENEYFVLHRETGAPLVRASAQLWYRVYDSNTRKYIRRQGENIVTNQQGYFQVAPSASKDHRNFYLELTHGNDHLLIDNYQYNNTYQPEKQDKPQLTSFLFTDRSIYRPGQLLYAKGIVINKTTDGKNSTVASGVATTILLLDANGQPIDSVKVTTSDYGSWNARFTLPSGVLNGQFQLLDKTSSTYHSFSVEEYKRPRFYTEINKPGGSYRLNDSITLTGQAKAYAGNNIDGASVRYRVVRRTVMPFWYYGFTPGSYSSSRIWPPYQNNSMEIAHGETSTDANGQFTIRFRAIPDNSVDRKLQPSFYYEVSADVTDISGETRSGSTGLSISYQALQLAINLPDQLPADSLAGIRISSTNSSDSFQQARVTLTLRPLTTPSRQFRQRLWQEPDQFLLSKEEYYRLFPYDIYSNEDNVQQWPEGPALLTITDTTAADSRFAIGKTRIPAGWYKVEASTTDKFGEPVKDIKYVQLTDQADRNPQAYVSIDTRNPAAEPGQRLYYSVRTNLDSAFVIHELERKGTPAQRTFFTLHQNSKGFELPVTEADRGGLGMQVFFVKHNRSYSATQLWQVPYTNKELSISYETFRDKTLPGSAEKWKVKISGYKNEKLAAELLTAMYDASLDQFKPQQWAIPGVLDYFMQDPSKRWSGNTNFQEVGSEFRRTEVGSIDYYEKRYDALLTGFEFGFGTMAYFKPPRIVADAAVARNAAQPQAAGDQAYARVGTITQESKKEEITVTGNMVVMGDSGLPTAAVEPAGGQQPATAPVRTNFNETAFFFPDLHTDAQGNIEFSFTMPEALTKWKWMSLAHTRDLAFGYSEKNIITQKELMVQPNAPRFLREGDRMDFSGKIVNLTDKELSGQVGLQLTDPASGQPVDGWFINVTPQQYFTVAAGQSTPVRFSIQIPYQYNRPVTYRMVASAGNLSDGEEAILPVVSNRMLVTESLPISIRGTASKDFSFTKLLQSGSSETLSQHKLTVEYTTNPAWYAVQALPYLMEYPYDCAEQVFNRYYANTLAASIVKASPAIKAIFDRWKIQDTAALLSNLQKNEELKALLLQETPWVLEARQESEQKKRIALLYDMVRMGTEQQSALAKLRELLHDKGGFMWFKGGPDDRYITQYILTGIGHLKKLKALPVNDPQLNALLKDAIPYLDQRIKEDYDQLLKSKAKITDNQLGYIQIQYLYMRSFFPEYAVPGASFNAYNFYRKQSQQFWLSQSRYMQGMIALSLHRTGDPQNAKKIIASLKENALVSEEMGMYWKNITAGYYWHQAPVETQALLIEAFAEVTNDTKAVEDLKTWLLKQKQTNAWRTTRATADACYALLMQGTSWLSNEPVVEIRLGDKLIRSTEQSTEAGTGYFKTSIDGAGVKPEMGRINVSVKNAPTATPSPSWGAVYWQYFENLDKITQAATPLKLQKKLYVEQNTDRGPVLQPLNEGETLSVGDKVKVRIELTVDRDMEYVHMKDMRAACMEPVNVLSGYKWQGGLGYYESTKDASTNFFFGALRKGTWIFEYPLFVTHTGTFSNGVTSIQCMYAPEFTAHSEGIKVSVEQ